jgi:hypothetical protein
MTAEAVGANDRDARVLVQSMERAALAAALGIERRAVAPEGVPRFQVVSLGEGLERGEQCR